MGRGPAAGDRGGHPRGPRLSEAQRTALIAVYRSMLERE